MPPKYQHRLSSTVGNALHLSNPLNLYMHNTIPFCQSLKEKSLISPQHLYDTLNALLWSLIPSIRAIL